MARVTVYIPERLVGRLERLRRQGEDLNLSEISRKALERAISNREAAAGGDPAFKIAERLKLAGERPALAYRSGQTEGRRWAQDSASWAEIQAVVGWDVSGLEIVEIVDQDRDGAVFGGMRLLSDGNDLVWPSAAPLPDVALSEPDRFDRDLCSRYVRGFQAAVEDVYRLVLPEMETDG